MNPNRLSYLRDQVMRCHRTLSRYGSIKNTVLPRVTLAESQWLAENKPTWLPYTRIFTSTDAQFWKNDMDRASPSQRPVIREIWVGQRSLATVGEDDAPEGHQRSQSEQEDIAELTDLQTMLYAGHEDVRRSAIWRYSFTLYRKVRRAHPEFTTARRKKLWKLALQEAEQEFASTAVIEDSETGEPRFVRPGDVIQIAWGSNEDLDALYMEEPASDRSEHDSMLRDLDRDQIRPNSYRENEFLENRQGDYVLHRDALVDDEIITGDEFPEVEWFTRSDYFAALERNHRQRGRILQKNAHKAAPAPMDWKAVRG